MEQTNEIKVSTEYGIFSSVILFETCKINVFF